MTTTDRLAARYLDVLDVHLGLETTRGDDVIVVRTPEREHLLCLTGRDPGYLRLAVAGRLETSLDADDLARVVAEVSATTKGVKATREGDLVVVACEMVIAPPRCLPSVEMLVAVLPRAFDMIDFGLRKVAEGHHVAEELVGITMATARAGHPAA